MVAALWSNSNWDDDKGTRKEAIEEIEENFLEVTEIIMSGVTPSDEAEIDEGNPFFGAAKKVLEKVKEPNDYQGNVEEVLKSQSDYGKFIDQ